ncbi:MAG: hypothetical protein WBC18_07955 [Ottowia sp.]|uniref:hypothetical protein n=1 Tax=Ottowia sp. TaxID=1898956 RepID=UPI003C7626F5
MSGRTVLNSHAPYERVCKACNLVRQSFEFTKNRRICTACANARMTKVPHIKPSGGLKKQPTYDGAELRPFTGRPGAMDAFALPSLRFGQRIYRRGYEPLFTTTKESS